MPGVVPLGTPEDVEESAPAPAAEWEDEEEEKKYRYMK